jgi:hypothetical protein
MSKTPVLNEPQSFLEIVLPVAEFQDAQRSVATHAPRRGVTAKRALLLPSEKSSSPPFIQALVSRMSGETDAGRVFMQNPQWAFFHPERSKAIAPEIDRLAQECDLMISGVAY